MNDYPYQYQLEWQGIKLAIRYNPDWLGIGFTAHIEVMAEEPLPITNTGYRSIFLNPGIVERHGGAVAYVTAFLEEEAAKPAWKQVQASRRQLALF